MTGTESGAPGIPVMFCEEAPARAHKTETEYRANRPTLTLRELILARLNADDRGAFSAGPLHFTPPHPPCRRDRHSKCIPKRSLQRRIDDALRAVTSRRLVVLVDERRVERLEDAIYLRSGTQITFLHLPPLQED